MAKMTRRQILTLCEKVISVGYCNLEYLLKGLNPIGYASGIYGWNYDVYFTDHDLVICTGYRSMLGENVDYDIVREYNGKAEKIYHDYNRNFDDRISDIDDLLKQFCECCKENIF